MLRIDETSKTLVAPQAGGLVTEAAPEREELLALVSSSWEAFSHELGMPNVRLVVLAGGFDPRALATVEWLSRRHGVEVSAFSVSVLRFGAERLLSVVREPRESQGSDPAAEVQWMLSGTPLPAAAVPGALAAAPAASSTPPPGA